MPKCVCGKSVASETLCVVGPNNRAWPEEELRCASCRRTKMTHLHTAEEPMSSQRKPVASINVFEAGTNDQGEMNYDLQVSMQLGGVKLEFEKTTDQIRQYFTEKKLRAEVRKGADLKMVTKTSAKN